MNDLYQKTYMDLNKEDKKMEANDKWGVAGGILLLLMYIAVSTMEYNDCLKGAISC